MARSSPLIHTQKKKKKKAKGDQREEKRAQPTRNVLLNYGSLLHVSVCEKHRVYVL